MSNITDAAKQAQQLPGALSEAAMSSFKLNQQFANKAFQTLVETVGTGLRTKSPSELTAAATGTVNVSFDLAKEALDNQREIAGKFIAAYKPAVEAAS